MIIILDTNFLMIPAQFGIDIFEYLSYFEIATMDACIKELRKIRRGTGRNAKAARIALKLAGEKSIEIIKSDEKNVDKAILNYALSAKCAVGTNDKELVKALKNNGIKVIRLRQKKYLAEE